MHAVRGLDTKRMIHERKRTSYLGILLTDAGARAAHCVKSWSRTMKKGYSHVPENGQSEGWVPTYRTNAGHIRDREWCPELFNTGIHPRPSAHLMVILSDPLFTNGKRHKRKELSKQHIYLVGSPTLPCDFLFCFPSLFFLLCLLSEICAYKKS